ncbi:cupin domain-containing protein [Paenibacillus albicereus]|uniref:Cupin domain-containing protein n=1 Tax=Paenibacillus albicereus TaxID=2726185 RepID=A0A6H2GSX9_9BACL|nr:cupin domain-containing protein [Paenibacillus albicereus]
MTVSYMDYTSPDLKFSFDMKKSTAFRTNASNYINILGYKQLPTLGSASLLDIFLSRGHYVEPHYHQNASELVYLISGSAIVSMINPFTNQLLSIPITPQEVVIVPQGWWHYEEATSDGTHILAIFDAPTPQVILGSDILRLTPAKVFAQTYCLDEAKWKEAISPIKQTVAIGPLDSCKQSRDGGTEEQGAEELKDAPNVGAISAYRTAPSWAGTGVSGQPAYVYGQSPFQAQPPYGQGPAYAQAGAAQPAAPAAARPYAPQAAAYYAGYGQPQGWAYAPQGYGAPAAYAPQSYGSPQAYPPQAPGSGWR